MNFDGNGQTRLTTNQDDDWSPAWSPNSREITFVSNRDQNFEVYVMNADGSNQTNLTNNPAMEDSRNARPSWSPDGNMIIFESQGHPRSSPVLRQILGITSILLQTGLLMGFVLLAMQRWTLPLGSLTLVFTLNTALMVSQEDEYIFGLIPAAGLAGLASDLLLHWLKPSARQPGGLRLFAFAVPTSFMDYFF